MPVRRIDSRRRTGAGRTGVAGGRMWQRPRWQRAREARRRKATARRAAEWIGRRRDRESAARSWTLGRPYFCVIVSCRLVNPFWELGTAFALSLCPLSPVVFPRLEKSPGAD